ncbi:hypothetical protein Tco_0340173 [Tanacetum coccineum]
MTPPLLTSLPPCLLQHLITKLKPSLSPPLYAAPSNHPTPCIATFLALNAYPIAALSHYLQSLATTLILIASPTLLLFHDDPYMKVMHAYNAIIPPPVSIPPPTIMPPSPMISPMFNPQNSFFLRNYCHLRNEAVTDHPPLLLPYLKYLRWEKALVRQVWKHHGNKLRKFSESPLDELSLDPIEHMERQNRRTSTSEGTNTSTQGYLRVKLVAYSYAAAAGT